MKMRALVVCGFAGLGALAGGLWVGVRERAPVEHPAAPERKPVEDGAASPRAALPPVAPRRQARADHASDTAGSGDVIGSTEPSAPNYDPAMIAQMMQAAPSEIVKKEPRDPAFAGPREAALRDRVVQRLRKRLPFETKVDAKCYTSSCELTVQGTGNASEMNDALQALELSRLADTAEIGPWSDPTDSQVKGLRITVLYSAALRDHAAYDQWLRQHEAHDDPAHKGR